MKLSNTGYVTIQKQSLLGMVSTIGVPSSKTRSRADGEIEAEFFCIRRADNCETIWAIRSELKNEAYTTS